MSLSGRPWVTFFSHTGTEIVNLSNRLQSSGLQPDIIITNEPRGRDNIHPGILDNIYVPNKPSVDDYFKVIPTDAIVTLHGWMRIVPPEICDAYKIFNLHPGLITKYPELKGKDPQAKVAELTDDYSKIGCVIHRVTSELDSGEVVYETSIMNNSYNEKTIINKLHDISLEMWVDFISSGYYNE